MSTRRRRRLRSSENAGHTDNFKERNSRVAALDPLYALAHRNLGLLLARAGNLPAARPSLEAALRLDPSDAELRAFLATLR